MAGYPSPTTYRPAIIGSHFVAVTGHYLATMAAVRMLEMGGNAVDAGVAAGHLHQRLAPGYDEYRRGRADHALQRARKGPFFQSVGSAPGRPMSSRQTTSSRMWRHDTRRRPTLRDARGTRFLADRARAFRDDDAGGGRRTGDRAGGRWFAAYAFMCENIAVDAAGMAQWPSNAAIFLPGGRAPGWASGSCRRSGPDAAHARRSGSRARRIARARSSDPGRRDRFYREISRNGSRPSSRSKEDG